ncbi:MAG: Hsp70 family protein, partial [Ruminococcus sp.]|nr:Hsp70 family protein [Ruminococcus sp.]
MQPIIGLDFGNFNSFTCYISDFDIGTRMGGEVYDLLPPKLQDGIPSVYYYSKKAGTMLGENAITRRAVPYQNRLRYLKRHLGENIKLDDRNISYDNAIVELIQYCVRLANEQMEKRWLMTTNLISLSYPATYNSAQRQRLIELVEKATLKDGQHLKVFGTITEPAAAALDYLAEFAKSDKDTTVLTYDLGGGTFDLSLVSTYPKGKKDSDGHVYYYDVINNRGISNLGGAEFDEIMFNLLKSKVNRKLSSNAEAKLRDEAEKIKVELSSSDDWLTQIFIEDDWIDINITRDE